ncbi:MAG: glycosyltransferase [Pyrinomonadaceae bacterium]|nr:glycosyltransferase [Pyrinomonadaceae bacterium]
MVDLKDLKVCFIAGTLARGGAERQLIYMLTALKSEGVNTRVLCLTKGEALEEEIRAIGVSVVWVGESRWRPIRLFRILQELRHQPANIVQSAHFYTNLYAAVAGRLLGIRSIGAIRSDLTSELKCSGIMGWGQLHLPGLLITNSKLARRRALDKGIHPDQIDVVPNVVSLKGVSKKLNTPKNGYSGNGNGNGAGAVRILFAGRLTEEKRADRFLRTLRMIVKERPDLTLTARIAGDGPLRKDLERLAAQLGLGRDHVEFLGELKDVQPFYYKSDFLMLTSDWEGTPNVLLEAMACGLPAVVTRVGGVPEIVGQDRGLMVEANDADGLTRATLRMIDDRSLRAALGHKGQEYVARFHSPKALREQLMALYGRFLKHE